MSVEILMLTFNIVFFGTNMFYLEMVESIFDTKSSIYKKFFFSLAGGLSGSIMLMLIGSMSSLGYFIMLIVYTIMIMSFYPNRNILVKCSCILSFNIHIMVARGLISAIGSIISGKSILELSQNPISFWMILIATALLCIVFIIALLWLIPSKFLKIFEQKSEHLILYIVLLSLANIYMIINGMVYIQEVNYDYVNMHQIVISIMWLAVTYVGIFMLVGFDILRENREKLENASIYKHVIESRSVALLEINCTRNELIRILKGGEQITIPEKPYSQFSLESINLVVHPDDYEKIAKHESIENILELYNNGMTSSSVEGRFTQSDNSIKWIRSSITTTKDKNDEIIAVISHTDDVHEFKTNELALQYKAEIDPLVNAYNKQATENIIKNYLLQHKTGALFMIDLDNFKAINDNFGHAFGDEVLKEVTNKISKNFRTEDIIGRVGGDEFIAFLKNNISLEEISKKANQICKQINKVYTQKGLTIEISSSIGISICPVHGKTFEVLYSKADIAMYTCKKGEKNGFVIYDSKKK